MTTIVEMALCIYDAAISSQDIWRQMNIERARISEIGSLVPGNNPKPSRNTWRLYQEEDNLHSVSAAWDDLKKFVLGKELILSDVLVSSTKEIHIISKSDHSPEDMKIPGELILFAHNSRCGIRLFWYNYLPND